MTTLKTLQQIIPPDQALSAQCLSRSVQQVQNIFNTTNEEFSQVVGNLETTKDLPMIERLDDPVPDDVLNYYQNVLATGTGPNKTLTTMDFFGTAAGNGFFGLIEAGNLLTELAAEGGLDSLILDTGDPANAQNGVYTVMLNTLNGFYTDPFGNMVIIPPGLPGAGTYTSIDDAFGNGLIQAGEQAILALTQGPNADTIAEINAAYLATASELERNFNNLTLAGFDFANLVSGNSNGNLLPNNRPSVMSFSTGLRETGLQIEKHGAAEFLTLTANNESMAGQAIVASMRESRNIVALQSVGINPDTQLVDINFNTQVSDDLGNSQYTVSQAQANLIY